jgi:hypothetical protein
MSSTEQNYQNIDNAINRKFNKFEFLKNHFSTIVKNNDSDAFICKKKNDVVKLNRTLLDFLGITSSHFAEHYERQVTGTGNESSKIDSIESSSRLALLCFCSVEDSPITIDIPNFGSFCASQCFFEAKNRVITLPSNIDILLVDKAQGETRLLYLESKYTEYIRDAEKDVQIGKSYFNKYENLMNSLSEVVDHKDSKIKTNEAVKHTYQYGLKQMISHFIGVVQGPAAEDKNFVEIKKLWDEADQIYLGTILYKFDENDSTDTTPNDNSYFSCYSKLHKKLAVALNAYAKDKAKRIKVIEKPLTYQDIFSGDNLKAIPSKVAKFYNFDK